MMLNNRAAALGLACVLATVPASFLGQDPRALLTSVSNAMGANNLRTIQFSGMGSNAGVGQNTNPNSRWPLVRVKSYMQEIDFTANASRLRLVRVQNNTDQTQERSVSRDSSWDSQYAFWLTPFGFLKGASANNASLRSATVQGTKYNVVSFSVDNKYKVVGYINDKNLVERVQTWIDNDVLGDMLVETFYDLYKDFDGVKFPTSIIEKQGGFPVLILSVTEVKPNTSVTIQPATPSVTNAAQQVSVQVEKVAEGVYYLKGGTHHSVAVEFADHVAVIEAPLNEERSLAVIAAVKQTIPNKPIRYLINTHHHFDHAGGLRTYVDEGATIVTHESNKGFYQQALAAPRTLNPDRLARSQKNPVIETVADKKVLSDATRMLELHWIKGNPHDDGILLAFLPKEKVLIEVDVFTPQNAESNATAAPVVINPSTVNTVESVEKLKLDFEMILPLHGPVMATRADLYKAINKPVPDIAAILAAATPAPVDPGRRALETACTVCHSLERIQTKNMPQDDWVRIIDDMKGKGAILQGNDEALLLEYLVKNYGPK
jgi:glyoxylase-like metal-dependent hydrolase (beta-lactamase superfamily II)